MNRQIETRRARVNGVDLNYTEQGEGDPVVFVHGSLGDFRNWSFQIEPLAHHYRAIAYSRRYHYPNKWAGDGSDYSAALHAEDLTRLIKGLKLGSVHVVASSYGAYIALLLVRKHPELIRSLVLGEPPLIPFLKDLPGGGSLAIAFMTSVWEPSQQAFRKGDLEQGVRIFIDGVLGKGVFDQIPHAVRLTMMDNAREMEAETTATNYFPSFTCEDARQIKAPTLLVTGERSPKMFQVITDGLKQCITHSERLIIPNASHAMHLGNPQVYNEAVIKFLKRH